jgi:hypothetical protein
MPPKKDAKKKGGKGEVITIDSSQYIREVSIIFLFV